MASRRTAFSPLVVLAVLLGVLGMHAVGGAGHEAHASPGPVAAMGAGHMTEAGGDAAAGGDTVDAGRPVSDGGAPVVALCLAVLVGVAVLLVHRRRSDLGPAVLRRLVPVRVSTARLGRGPPKLLLAELCVLRT